MPDLKRVLSELRRRRVFGTAALYIIGAVAVVEAADAFFPALGLEQAMTPLAIVAVAGLPVALVLAWMFDIRPAHANRPTPARAPGELQSVAILPFANLSPDPENEYFSDGLTEELLNRLARIERLRVPARTSSFAFKGRLAPVREIGEALGVETVLEGGVRRSGSRVRITAQLVNVSDGFRIWSDVFDRELTDIFQAQEDVASAIVRALGLELSTDDRTRLHARPTYSIEAHDLYLRGRHVAARGDPASFAASVRYFERALELDPGFADAYMGLVDTHLIAADALVPPQQAHPLARAAAQRALELQPDRSDAHAALGWIHASFEWNWSAAEREFRRALELDPDSPLTNFYWHNFLAALGRYDEAVAAAQHAIALDPLSPLPIYFVGAWTYRWMRDVGGMRAQAERLHDIDPHGMWYHDLQGIALEDAGQLDAAIESYRRAVEASQHTFPLCHYACALAAARRHEDARAVLGQLQAMAREGQVPPTIFAWVHARLGEPDAAFEWLQRAVEQRDGVLLMLNGEPLGDPLRVDPRFIGILQQVGLAPLATA